MQMIDALYSFVFLHDLKFTINVYNLQLRYIISLENLVYIMLTLKDLIYGGLNLLKI